jgi:DNA polymerase I-like protein with 3'-5' exonuclease and polymerase domains
MVNEVHDSIVFDCPNDEIDTIVEISKDVMENISKFSKLYAPHIDFSWLRCPLIADAEVGTHYGSEISYEEWRKT